MSAKNEYAYEESLIRDAVKQIESSVFGQFLIAKFPVRLVTPTYCAKEYAVLCKYGSPACTDGKEVFVSAKTTHDILMRDMYDWDWSKVPSNRNREDLWKLLQTNPERKIDMTKEHAAALTEVHDIILHELTHAINEHNKLQRSAESKTQEYQQKLAVACELQANDGILGRTYEMNFTQQLQGVTNKRKHPETIGCHTLKEFMEKLVLTPEEKNNGQGQAQQQAKARSEMAKASGNEQKIDEQIEKEQKQNPQKGKGGSYDDDDICNDKNKSSTQKVMSDLQKEGLQNIKQLILATLSDKLKYDPTSDSVIYNQVRKRELKRTYARPSRRIGMYENTQYQIMRKGVKVERKIEYNKTRDLVVLAVDASGSMEGQAQYVSAILDDLLKQVEKVAREHGIEVNYDNLQGMFHTERASKLMPITGAEWQQRMTRYEANGGNDFDCVLDRISSTLAQRSGEKDYESITVINLSDGLGYLEADFSDTPLGKYIEKGRLKWVDTLITRPRYAQETADCIKHDYHKIRVPVVLAVEGEQY